MAKEEKPLRFSTPPYVLVRPKDEIPLFVIPGCAWEAVSANLAPGQCEFKVILHLLRMKLRWSRPMLAAFLGVSRHTLRRWEDGTRTPSLAAKRLIWIVNQLLYKPKTIRSALDLLVWGKGPELRRLARAMRARTFSASNRQKLASGLTAGFGSPQAQTVDSNDDKHLR